MAERALRKGDVVSFEFGNATVQGVVTEDRGPIGMHGRRLYAIEFRVDPDSDDPMTIELPAGELHIVHADASIG